MGAQPTQPVKGRTGKHRNPLLVWLVWPFITLGIYHLVWWYKINREARELDPRIDVSPGVAVLALFPGSVLLVPPFVSIWRTGERIRTMQRAAGTTPTCIPLVGLLLTFVLGLQSLYYQMELNRLWRDLGDPPEGTPVALV